LSKNVKLKAIKLEYGKTDMYPWIPNGCEAMAKVLKKNKINYELNSFDGGHEISPNAASEDFIPFFVKNLVVK